MNAVHDPYTFTFRAEAGGGGAGPAQYSTLLRVDGARGRALLLLNRHNGDTVRRPIGLFATTLSPVETSQLAAVIDAVRWAELPRPEGGDVSAAMLGLDYARGGRIVQRRFNARNHALIEALAPLMSAVDELSSTLLTEPRRAIDVSLQRTGRGFTLTLRNVGTGPVMLADPRALGRASIAVAPDVRPTPGRFSPMPTFLPVPLEAPAAPGTSISLAAGQTCDMDSVAWAAPAAGSYVAQGSWKDYAGPAAEPDALLPALPDGEDVDSDPRAYPLRGAAFSGYVHFTAEKRR